jgi:cell division protein FtsW
LREITYLDKQPNKAQPSNSGLQTSGGSRKGRPDFALMIMTLLLVGLGLVMVYSSSQIITYTEKYNFDTAYFFKKQLIWIVIGLIAMVTTMNFPYWRYRKLILIILPALFLVMIYVLVAGDVRNGARSWIDLGFMSIQPSEFSKLGIIIYLAHIYSKKEDKIQNLMKGVIPPLLVVFAFFTMIVVQPDLGSSMSIILFTALIIFCSGAQFKHMIALGITSGIALLAVSQIKPYWRVRLTSFWNPWDDPQATDYQLGHSLYAIGNGGFNGAGLSQSIMKYFYLPEAHTDFIFSILAEELGFIGVTFTIVLYVAFILRGIYIANRCRDLFGTLLAIGITSMIGLQALINISITSGIFPITGLTLPFLSYGGSSLVLTMASVGILLNISRYFHSS